MLKEAYDDVRHHGRADLKSSETGDAILRLARASLDFLVNDCQQISLVSRVPDKQYLSFRRANVVARPANRDFFLTEPETIPRLWQQWLEGAIAPTDLARLTYTIALAPCLAMELFDRQNKKGPATFFEHYIGHLFGTAVGANPTRNVRLPVHGREIRMTMDFLIELGENQPRIHLPVKMSTRERVVQAWAHQRLLDAAYGKGSYRGVMVLFAETKLDSRSLEVVEICVPDQWLAYQTLLAQMETIYYFDVPVRYQELTTQFPNVIAIKPFQHFLSETKGVPP